MIHTYNATEEFYNKFKEYIGKTFFIKTIDDRSYDGIILVSMDREGSPIRFLNFKNKEGFSPKILAFVPSEIKRYEVKE